ncbi:MAG: transcription/translation regulatory transformer protein RfaH [Chromatiaceae bacterium]|nr:MAG: transcription/translation regulatory transformer protein RfaH [Chromatiaceae bacterium]
MKRWYVVHTRPRQEVVAEENLLRQAFDVYLPRLKVSRRRRAKWVDVVECLFPRYLFARIDIAVESTALFRSTRGVNSLVRFGDQLVHLEDEIVAQIRAHEHPQSGLHQAGGGRFQHGDRVRAVRGPLTDIEGIFLAEKGADRVVILMHLLNRDTCVTLPCHHIIPISA